MSSAGQRPGTVLFELTFTTDMSDRDLAALTLALDLSAPPLPSASSGLKNLGFARLDYFSGVFLRQSTTQGQWILEARTWGHPASIAVHGWHVMCAQAARQLDPAVVLPDRLPDDSPHTPNLSVYSGANTRMGRLRRRLVGLP